MSIFAAIKLPTFAPSGQNYPQRGKGQGHINAPARRPLPFGALDPIPRFVFRWPKR